MKPRNKKYQVTLSLEERENLSLFISSGKSTAKKILDAPIWLKAAQSLQSYCWNDKPISEAFLTIY